MHLSVCYLGYTVVLLLWLFLHAHVVEVSSCVGLYRAHGLLGCFYLFNIHPLLMILPCAFFLMISEMLPIKKGSVCSLVEV